MRDGKNVRLYIAGAVMLALVLGLLLPRHVVGSFSSAEVLPTTEATVPGQLLSGDAIAGVGLPAPAPSPPATQIAVYICGDVHRPGVYSFGPNLRVADGIARAGGALPDADLEQLNLAQPMSDAMKIDVPKKGERVAATLLDDSTAVPSSHYARRHSAHRGGRSSHKLAPGQTLNVNTASESELTSLPGVGPGLARRIVEYRTENGQFQSVDDLQNVSGIGPSKFDRMAPYVRI